MTKPTPQFRIRPDASNRRRFQVESNRGAGWRVATTGFTAAEVDNYVQPLRRLGIEVEQYDRQDGRAWPK